MSEDRRRGSASQIIVRPNPWLIVVLFVTLMAIGYMWFSWRGLPGWSLYGGAVALVLGTKLMLSLLPAKRWGLAPRLRVGVVVPFYNEDPAILRRSLMSIDKQSYKPRYVFVVDDGSSSPAARQMARQWAASRPYATVIHQLNAGKREALAQGFRALRGKVDVFLCVDSDTVLERHAIWHGIAPFNDPKVAAVTGTVMALNPDRGMLPRLLDLRYVNAFLYERAAYSRLGSVLCVCGSLAFWRADVIEQRLDEFLNQSFLGQRMTYGDDRHLTNLSLLHGKVVLAKDAVARTAVPERSGHLIRQQIRWGKSFFRESWFALSHLSPRRISWWLAAVESISWAGFSIGLLTTAMILPVVTGEFRLLDYLGWVILAGYGRSVHVFSVRRPDWSRWEQFGAFLLAPAYGILHVMVLLPLRIYSLCTLHKTEWGTRSVVEVAQVAA
jgi:hyaluronan synthase